MPVCISSLSLCLLSPLQSVSVCSTGDDTLKLWDIRAMKRPINVAAGLESVYSVTSCVFSPDDQLVSTGTSIRKGQVRVANLNAEVKGAVICAVFILQGSSKVVFFDRTMTKVEEVDVSDAVSLIWLSCCTDLVSSDSLPLHLRQCG